MLAHHNVIVNVTVRYTHHTYTRHCAWRYIDVMTITVHWESSTEEKVCEFRESGSIRECFLAHFNLGWNFYILDCLNRKSFLANYGKEGNS